MKTAHKQLYNQWGYQRGIPADLTKCAAEIVDGWHWKQCSRPCGHGHLDSYCKQHAKRHPKQEQRT